MSMPTTFVRVLDEFGNRISVPHDEPLIETGHYELLDDEEAVDRYGVALPPTPAPVDGDGHLLRGQALTDALTNAGLPTTGKVAEKQARLAEWQADHPATTEV